MPKYESRRPWHFDPNDGAIKLGDIVVEKVVKIEEERITTKLVAVTLEKPNKRETDGGD